MPLFGGPPNIDKLKAKGDVPGLIKAMEHQKDLAARRRAAEALVGIGAPAVEPLITALRGEEAATCQATVAALGAIGDARAVEPLIATLANRGQDEFVRTAAAKALGVIGDARAVEPLIATLEDRNKVGVFWIVGRQAAAGALGAIGDPRAVGPLIAALAERGARAAAATALGVIGDPRAVEPLIAALAEWRGTSGDKFERQAAVEALGAIGAPAVEPLIVTLGHYSADVRAAAARALDRLAWSPDGGQTGAAY